MSLLAVGLNHNTAPVQIRERVAFPPENLSEVLRNLASHPQISEAAILSTCNRTEILCCMDTTDSALVVDWFRHFHKLNKEDIEPYLYTHYEQYAVQHLLRVASGLDSMILGEPQILGQVKDAYFSAKNAGTAGRMLCRLFEHCFSVAKQIRTDTAIGASPVSVAFAAVSLAKQIFSSLEERTVMLVGAGDTIELAARHLHESNIGRIIVANRTLSRAQALTTEFHGLAITLGEIPDHLHEADIVITSTASQLPILGKGAVERAIKTRKHQPILMIDIAVPRDIEPEVGELDDIYLYTVDNLKEIIDEGLKSRKEAALQAEEIIATQVEHFLGWLNSLDTVSSICEYREKAYLIRNNEVERAKQMLAQGVNPDQVISQLARSLTNKIIHAPSAHMRRASYENRNDFLKAARELLDLKDPEN